MILIVGFLGCLVGGFAGIAQAHELSGFLAVEGRFFTDSPLFTGQEEHNVSLALQPEYYHQWQSGLRVTFVPFGRLDSADDQRSHFDIRELNLLYPGESWEVRFGIGKVFWGATEFVHLVDIVNQTDGVESIDGEDKLGQPMLHLSLPRAWGIVDFFALPFFRERTFPGQNGRLRSELVVDPEHPLYESGAEENHFDFALRYSHTLGELDFGLSYFNGTDRQPMLSPGLNRQGAPVLIPYYGQIQQFGLDLQWVFGGWLWKLESIYRQSEPDHYLAAVGGFEYTFSAIMSTVADLGLIGEYAYDDRNDAATTPYEKDAMLGLRLAFNDAASSELLAGIIIDLDSSARIVSLEANRRFGERFKATLEAGFFVDLPENDLAYSLRDDDFVRLDLAFYY
ncbi:MAG: hypothetical protein KKB30_14435 [Proteobacteria bacterium]|nr:hypothetical protein [Pseudomonadota bacterium]MBU1715576.1 hypothetical protein [Pseudomonadota bacterium]